MARIVQVADTFDAMIAKRPYNSPRTHADALDELRRESGRQFDPRVTEAFLDTFTLEGR
jgi:HD-GYP domain-containing protein (c-di-GMP phosphodiesterase class II)